MIPIDRRVRGLDEAVRSVLEADAVGCGNCRHVHWDMPTNLYQCWKSPPTAVAAWVQTREGSMNLQVGAARPPVLIGEWCSKFSRKGVV